MTNNLFVVDNNQPPWTSQYYNYVVELFVFAAKNLNLKCNFVFGNLHYNFKNDLPTIKIDMQIEHTIVKPGGRDSWGAEEGVVPFANGNYLVRIMGYDYLNTRDIIAEYSNPNIENIKRSKKFDQYLSKVGLISPLIYEPKKLEFIADKKNDCVTMFVNTNEPRRRAFLDSLKQTGLPNVNIQNCFYKNDLEHLYKNTKIMLNIRQTEHHDTLEELRILPALLNGVIVVTEDCPLKEFVPYNQFLFFSSINQIAKKSQEILDNYKDVWESIFLNEKFLQTMQEIYKNNLQTAEKKLLNFLDKVSYDKR